MITVMRPEHVRAVAAIHAAVLPESIYSQLGRPFLEYYYGHLSKRAEFFCHVHLFNGTVTGFFATTCRARDLFFHQVAKDIARIGAVFLRIVAADPRKLALVWSAARFLFVQRPRLLPDVDSEALSLAILPQFRTVVDGPHGRRHATEFFAATRVSVAVDLFYAAMENLSVHGARDIKIMTPSDNPTSNRFYAKAGCRRVVEGVTIFGSPTNLYVGRVDEILARREANLIQGAQRP